MNSHHSQMRWPLLWHAPSRHLGAARSEAYIQDNVSSATRHIVAFTCIVYNGLFTTILVNYEAIQLQKNDIVL